MRFRRHVFVACAITSGVYLLDAPGKTRLALCMSALEIQKSPTSAAVDLVEAASCYEIV